MGARSQILESTAASHIHGIKREGTRRGVALRNVEKKVKNRAYSTLWLDSHSGESGQGVPFFGTSLPYTRLMSLSRGQGLRANVVANCTRWLQTYVWINFNEIFGKIAVSSSTFQMIGDWQSTLLKIHPSILDLAIVSQGFPRRMSAGNSVVKLGQSRARCSELFGRKVNAWIMQQKELVSFSCDLEGLQSISADEWGTSNH